MALTQADVEKVALLARLRLESDELEAMTSQLARVVDYVDQLARVETEGIEPLAHPIDMTNVFRQDAVTTSLPRDEALANAPHGNSEGYLVPAVLGE